MTYQFQRTGTISDYLESVASDSELAYLACHARRFIQTKCSDPIAIQNALLPLANALEAADYGGPEGDPALWPSPLYECYESMLYIDMILPTWRAFDALKPEEQDEIFAQAKLLRKQ